MSAQSSGGWSESASTKPFLKAVPIKAGEYPAPATSEGQRHLPRIYNGNEVHICDPCRPANVPSLIIKIITMGKLTNYFVVTGSHGAKKFKLSRLGRAKNFLYDCEAGVLSLISDGIKIVIAEKDGLNLVFGNKHSKSRL
jgi:hypothetical protein